MIGEESDTAVLRGAIAAYGTDNQLLQAVEELSELQKVCLHIRRGRATMDELKEELADVWIMVDQLCLIGGIGRNELLRERRRKLLRLERGLAKREKQ